jgi:hypothetical protein
VVNATVIAVRCLKHLQRPTAVGMLIPLVPFERMAPVTNLALRFKRKLGSSESDSACAIRD